ncbi:MFS transporter [Neolewinella antarctica]|uniref:Nucleoside transporter n=1 Tax=Neolewinella antarctica TaxID=442734 RepID=A0ABX0XFR5_9BACT|nr:MFS transporter [Neolewinella antarctica]NJC27618.1 nucleoside transporter [Neolewinella antarctica]
MSLTFRLSALQWLQNSVYATTAIALGTYLLEALQFSGREVGLVYASSAIAATVAPPAIGWLADRHLRADRMLIWLNLAAALALVGCYFATSFVGFYAAILVFNLCFIPTFTLLNSICFHQLERPADQFPFVRTWGTIGFMLVGVSLSLLGWEATPWPLLAGAVMAVLTAVLSTSLDPIQPQPGFSWADLKGEEVGRIIREPGMLVLMVAMLLSCIPSSFYYSFVNPFLNEVGWPAAAAKMSLGQVIEIGALLSMPLLLRKVRFRKIIFWGLFVWGARYVAFAFGRPGELEWLLYAGVMVQGIAFVWIVIAAQIYIDKRVPVALRSTAQGLITFANQGFGIIVGSWLAGEVVNAYELPGGGHAWEIIWLVPGVVGLITALGFWWFFPRAGRL